MPLTITQVQGGQLALCDSDGNILAIIDDSGAKLLRTAARLHDGSTFYTGAKESGGNLADIKSKTDNIPSDPARESGKLTSLETLITAIKNTDGIKKIVDQLPAGNNEIGKAAQGGKAAGSDAWPQVLYDADGHAVGVVLDGSVYRLRTEGKVAKGSTDLVILDAIDTLSGCGRLKTTLYTPEGEPVAFGSVAPNPSSIKNDFVKASGSDSLLVNGSVTPVIFTYAADAIKDISLQELKFVLSANGVAFGTNYFGSIAGPLTNGLLVEVVAGGNTGTVYNLLQNESFVNFASPGGFEWVVSSKDLMASTWLVGGGLKLVHGTSDVVRVTVRDDLHAAGIYFKCFVKGNLLG
jgi:hypothetical protein